ncbi:hypothetical protein [Bosea sp. PAMC 26642]|uniref:hypothetical protein n=1 Tax=Bosea sp. (strain PAMC 26642) TaxID=1792307 RepID=UPI000AFE1A8A|nr:hypothetical protein [Bosea sp. PAMC 26642]
MLIRSQLEYAVALAAIAKLEGLPPASPERARLPEITEAIEAWECVNRITASRPVLDPAYRASQDVHLSR